MEIGHPPVEPSAPVPLLHPRDGVPDIVDTAAGVEAAAHLLAAGSGPVAVDAERASGYKYAPRAYLVQLRRAGAGTVLLDPIPTANAMAPLAEVLNPLEWILHAADQDLPGLAELGLRPVRLFDTELAARIAGYERVGLGALVESILGLHLSKAHSAADWSTRPIPQSWLNYAALDVELLIELREVLAAVLDEQGKSTWAEQEFEYVLNKPPAPPNPERWRRTTNIHSIRDRRKLAAVRELWRTRDSIAAERDIAPRRILPDDAIIIAATREPHSAIALREMPFFNRSRHRPLVETWFAAVQRARELPDDALPPMRATAENSGRQSYRPRANTDAADRLTQLRDALAAVGKEHSTPPENLLAPELVRRLSMNPPDPITGETLALTLAQGGARQWQIDVTLPALTAALEG